MGEKVKYICGIIIFVALSFKPVFPQSFIYDNNSSIIFNISLKI